MQGVTQPPAEAALQARYACQASKIPKKQLCVINDFET